jgi:hypothetical protein
MEIASKAGRRRRNLVIAAILVVEALFFMSVLDRFIYNNDPLHSLDFGYDIGGEDPDVSRFYNAAIQNCRAHEASEEVDFCANYQQNILANLYLNYPIHNLFGALLQYPYKAGDFLAEVGKAAIWATLIGLLLAFLASIAPLAQLPSKALWSSAIILGLGGLAQRLAGKPAIPSVVPFWTPSVLSLLSVLVGAGAFALLLKSPDNRLLPARRWGEGLMGPRGRWLLLLIPLFLLIGRGIGIERELFQIAAALAFIVLLLVFAVQAELPALPAVAIGVVMYGLVNQSFALTLPISRMQGFFVFAILLCYATLRPKGKLVWLMPTTWFFHVSVAGLTAFVIAIAEAILCLRRRRFSPLLGASLLTAVPALTFGLTKTSDPLTSISGAALLGTAEQIIAAGPAVFGSLGAILLLLGLAGALLWRSDEAWDAVARFALLLIAVTVALLISNLMGGERAAYEPNYYLIIMGYDYFAPAITLGGLLGLTGLLVVRSTGPIRIDSGAPRPPAGSGRAEVKAGSERRWLVAVAAAICLILAKGPSLSVAKSPAAVLNGPAMVFLGHMPLFWSKLAPAAANNDDYYLNAAKPRNDPITYFSLLKMKVRKATGQFDPSSMRIFIIDGDKVTPVQETSP